jgi:hypothetical protein
MTALRPDARRRHILELLDRQEYATVTEIRRLTGASAATIQRDLARLAATGELTRLHGGAARAHGSERAPQPVAWLADLDLVAAEDALRCQRWSLVRQSSGTKPFGPGTPWSAGWLSGAASTGPSPACSDS